MNGHQSIDALGQSQAKPRTRARAEAKITVLSSDAKPYDQTARPASMEIRLSERSSEISMANHWFGLYRPYATINLPASSACNDFAENWADARARSCFKVQKSSRTARLRRHGLSFPDREQMIFPGCAARAALKVTLEEGPTERWIIGSNDVVTIIDSRSHGRRPKDAIRRSMYVTCVSAGAAIVPHDFMTIACKDLPSQGNL